LSFFITIDQYIHYFALNTLHILTMDKKKSICQAQPRRDTLRSRCRKARRSRATRVVARVSRVVLNNKEEGYFCPMKRCTFASLDLHVFCWSKLANWCMLRNKF